MSLSSSRLNGMQSSPTVSRTSTPSFCRSIATRLLYFGIVSSQQAGAFLCRFAGGSEQVANRPYQSKLHHSRFNMNTNNHVIENKSYDLAQDSSELFDVYPPPPSQTLFNSIIDESWGDFYFPQPKPIGESKERSKVHADGDWHRSVQVWIVQQDSTSRKVRVLLQRRSTYKDTHPNLLDVSCAGHVNAGDDVMQTALRELKEELGGNGLFDEYTLEEIERNCAFTVASSIQGETEKYGKFICNEYQDVFILWWDRDVILEPNLFAPIAQEEVSVFEVFDGEKLLKHMREGSEDFVPRSVDYIDTLEKALGCDRSYKK